MDRKRHLCRVAGLLACLALGAVAKAQPPGLASTVVAGSLTSQASPESPQVSFDLAAYADHPQVRSQLRYFQSRGRDTMERWLERGERYLPMIRRRLAEARLPQELCWLPMIESGFSNSAVSRKGAVGMWQFMPETARLYGLRVDRFVDERRNPLKSTDAAVRHLSDLLGRFGSPYLAAAAYNAGTTRVQNGLERLEGDERPPGGSLAEPAGEAAGADADFFRLADASLLARETRTYVPRWIAASMIGRDPDRYGFDPRSGNSRALDSVVVTRATRLDEIARLAGVSERAVREGPDPPRHVRVRRGETLEEIARRCGVSASALAKANVIPRGYRLHPSQILRLP
jgi:membrane-bound lytic murein transglycosylase D